MKYIVVFYLFLSIGLFAQESVHGVLNSSEKLYLEKKQQITMCIDPDWLPFEKIEDGKHIGMTSEYFKLFENEIGIPIKMIPTTTWSESIEFAKQRKCDIFSLAMETTERKEYMNFTKPYVITPLVFITQLDTPFINSPKDVLNHKLGITKGYAFVEILKEKYPRIQLVEYDKLSDGLDAVAKGKIFAYIDNLYTSGDAIQKKYVGELKITGKFDESWNLSIGVRNDDLILLKIFDKIIEKTKDRDDFRQIANNWISVTYDKGFDYGLALKISLFFLVVIGFLIYKHRLSQKFITLLKIQKEEFETIFKKSQDGIAIVDLNSRFLEFNDAYMKMTEYTKEELHLKSCIELTIEQDKNRTTEIMKDVMKIGFVESFEKSCLTKSGGVIFVNMSLSLMPDRKRIIVVTKNVTQNKLFESQTKLASMGEMIGNIAHQWRQPLSLISSGVTGMQIQKEYGVLSDEKFNETCDLINKNAQYLSRTIDDFRNFIKDEQEKKEFVIANTFEKTFSIVDPILKNHNIQVIKNIDDSIICNGYENDLEQVFINMINNAKDALIENENIVEKYIFIDLTQHEDKIKITIKDNGGGIEQSLLNRIFEPYFTTKHQSQGTGLGLSISYKIITQLHEGILSVSNVTFEYHNKHYTGAEFVILL